VSFKLYATCHAVKTHFTSRNYDFLKYGGKTRVKPDSYERGNQKFFYERFSRKIRQDEYITFAVSNVFAGNTWIGSYSLDTFHQFQMDVSGYLEKFESDLIKLLKIRKSLDTRWLLQMYFAKKIHWTTMISFDLLFNVFSEASSLDDIQWKVDGMRLEKVKSFVERDFSLKQLKNSAKKISSMIEREVDNDEAEDIRAVDQRSDHADAPALWD
jgi:hypothetical protein